MTSTDKLREEAENKAAHLREEILRVHLISAEARVKELEAGLVATRTDFAIGDRVLKHTGDYQLEGEVRGVITTKAGKVRYVVEHSPGFLHIYSGTQLTQIKEHTNG